VCPSLPFRENDGHVMKTNPSAKRLRTKVLVELPGTARKNSHSLFNGATDLMNLFHNSLILATILDVGTAEGQSRNTLAKVSTTKCENRS